MKIIGEFKRTGKIVSGIITKVIFEEGEKRGDCTENYSKDGVFFIKTDGCPYLYKYHLYVHGSDKDKDSKEFSYEYKTIEEAKEVMEYIEEFYAKECTDGEVLEDYEPEFKEGELVEVSSDGRQEIYLTTLPSGKVFKHLCVLAGDEEDYYLGNDYNLSLYRKIRKIQPKKTITIKVTPEQEKAINKILNK